MVAITALTSQFNAEINLLNREHQGLARMLHKATRKGGFVRLW